MKDHGDLDDHETAQALGEMLERMRQALGFTVQGAVATTGFQVDGVAYEVTLRKAVQR